MGFMSRHDLKKHYKSHEPKKPKTNEKNFHCDVCNKSYKQQATIKIHLNIHAGLTAYKCKICGESFETFYYRKRHMVIHTEGKKYPCDVCDKTFDLLHELKRHIKTHAGEKN